MPGAEGGYSLQSSTHRLSRQVAQLHTQARVLRCEYTAEGIEIEAVCDEICYGRLRGYEKK